MRATGGGRARPGVGLAIAVLLALGACSSGGDDGAASRRDRSGETPSVSYSGKGGEQFCAVVKAGDPTAIRDSSDPAALRQSSQRARQSLQQLSASAPAELGSDVQVVTAGISQFLAALERANFDVTRMSPDALEAFTDPNFEAALNRYRAYLSQVCGIKS